MAAANVGHSFGARTPTGWQQTQAAQSARHAMARRFIEEGALANQAFARVQSNQIDGMVKLTATVALDHLNAASTSALTVVNLIRASQAFVDVPSATEQAAVSILDLRV
jgi:hypothetical protein